jgi:hypothetical protein
VDTAYTCKWFAPLGEVHIEEPDYYAADVWDKALLEQGRRNEGRQAACLAGSLDRSGVTLCANTRVLPVRMSNQMLIKLYAQFTCAMHGQYIRSI